MIGSVVYRNCTSNAPYRGVVLLTLYENYRARTGARLCGQHSSPHNAAML